MNFPGQIVLEISRVTSAAFSMASAAAIPDAIEVNSMMPIEVIIGL
jgi:hypothetical protein